MHFPAVWRIGGKFEFWFHWDHFESAWGGGGGGSINLFLFLSQLFEEFYHRTVQRGWCKGSNCEWMAWMERAVITFSGCQQHTLGRHFGEGIFCLLIWLVGLPSGMFWTQNGSVPSVQKAGHDKPELSPDCVKMCVLRGWIGGGGGGGIQLDLFIFFWGKMILFPW